MLAEIQARRVLHQQYQFLALHPPLRLRPLCVQYPGVAHPLVTPKNGRPLYSHGHSRTLVGCFCPALHSTVRLAAPTAHTIAHPVSRRPLSLLPSSSPSFFLYSIPFLPLADLWVMHSC